MKFLFRLMMGYMNILSDYTRLQYRMTDEMESLKV